MSSTRMSSTTTSLSQSSSSSSWISIKKLSYLKDFIVILILIWSMIRTLIYSTTITQSSSSPIGYYNTAQQLEQQLFLPSQVQSQTLRTNGDGQDTNNNKQRTTTTVPLDILVDTHRVVNCTPPLIRMNDRIVTQQRQAEEEEGSYSSRNTTRHYHHNQQQQQTQIQRKIPKIVHVTSKSRCLTSGFISNLQKWQFHDHSFYIHDDEAINRLVVSSSSQWKIDFPHIPLAMKCLRSGASKADLWRYLILWEYGGIYTDLDNAPGKDFFISSSNPSSSSSSSTNNNINNRSIIIQDDDDAFFVVEKLGVLSQYFMAASPRHPLLYLAIQNTLLRLLQVPHVGQQYIPQVTGPGALKVAFKYFMRTPDTDQNGRVKQGHYVGIAGRSVTVIGQKETESYNFIQRATVSGKGSQYKQMNMKHYSTIAKKKFNESCLVHIYHLDHYRNDLNLTNW